MEEQSGREFASADPPARAQDATLQERGLIPEVSLNPRRRLQHFQRPTPSRLSSISPRAPRRGDDHVARGRRGGLKNSYGVVRPCASHGNVTVLSIGQERHIRRRSAIDLFRLEFGRRKRATNEPTPINSEGTSVVPSSLRHPYAGIHGRTKAGPLFFEDIGPVKLITSSGRAAPRAEICRWGYVGKPFSL